MRAARSSSCRPQVVFDAVGDVIKVTPNFNPDFAAVACPALGGHPEI
jgi:hypothetical protein